MFQETPNGPRVEAKFNLVFLGNLLVLALSLFGGMALLYALISLVSEYIWIIYIIGAVFLILVFFQIIRLGRELGRSIYLKDGDLVITRLKGSRRFPINRIKNIQWQVVIEKPRWAVPFSPCLVINTHDRPEDKPLYLNAHGYWSSKDIDLFVKSIRRSLKLPEDPAERPTEWFFNKIRTDQNFRESVYADRVSTNQN